MYRRYRRAVQPCDLDIAVNDRDIDAVDAVRGVWRTLAAATVSSHHIVGRVGVVVSASCTRGTGTGRIAIDNCNSHSFGLTAVDTGTGTTRA